MNTTGQQDDRDGTGGVPRWVATAGQRRPPARRARTAAAGMSVRTRPPTRHGLARHGNSERRRAPATVTPVPRRPPPGPIRTANADTGDVNERLLFTAEQAAELLQVRPSWLRRKAAARAVPCRFLGKHLRFSRADINAIAEASAQPPRQRRRAPSTD